MNATLTCYDKYLDTGIESLLIKGSFNLLQDAVHTVMKGETLLQPKLGIPIHQAEQAIQVVNTLTETQRFCFKQIALKKSIEEIAHFQKTTPSTVKDHLLQCCKKLGVKTTDDLIKLYHEFYPVENENSNLS